MKFPKKDRLVSRSDFAAVFDASHSSSGKLKAILHIDPYIVYKKSGNIPRIGLSISKRVIRKANERNRIKRCIREFFRINKDKLSGDFIVRIVSRPVSDDFKVLTQPLEKLFLNSERKTRKADS